MHVTVIVCTYSRCHTLAVALESVAASILPPRVEWEVLVVDNNSHDQTREVVEHFCAGHPGRFRYLLEPRQGKSYALNSGIKESHGKILAFMDDDVTVEPDWLHNLTAPIENGEWAGAGGRIVLTWPDSLPGWLSVHGPLARHIFPGFDQGEEAKELVGPPFGTNMAFRREVFEQHGGFRTDLGPTGNSQLRTIWNRRISTPPVTSEDTEFGRRLIAAGERLRYEPSAVVYHPVPESRINQKHFLRWYFDKGRADGREFPDAPVHLVCSLGAWTFRWIIAIEPRARFYRKLVVWEKAGQFLERYWLLRNTPDTNHPAVY